MIVHVGYVTGDRSLGIYRVGTIVWDFPLGIFRVGSFAWDLSLGIIRLVSKAGGNWSPKAGEVPKAPALHYLD